MTTVTVDAILDRTLMGYDLSPEEGLVLLKQTDPIAIAAIRATSDKLRQQQAGDIVTYVINRNINFTNICERYKIEILKGALKQLKKLSPEIQERIQFKIDDLATEPRPNRVNLKHL
ncbi:hypothetical protein NUACC21_08420 [Scytonema sp. NUACC21]